MSNRADFLEMREQEAFENPQDYERPEERKNNLGEWRDDYIESERQKYKEEFGDLPYHLNLEARSRDYIAAIKANNGAGGNTDFSDIDFNAKFIGPKILTEFQKLHFVSEASEEVKTKNIKECEDGFKKLRGKSRLLDNM